MGVYQEYVQSKGDGKQDENAAPAEAPKEGEAPAENKA